MRKLLGAGIASGLLAAASVALADDDQPGRWSGWYVGLHGGGGWGTTTIDNPYGPSIYGDDIHPSMFFAGLQGGYNWQSASNPAWVFGIEGDATFADSDATNTCNQAFTNAVGANCHSSPDFFATLTGRLGHAFGPEGRTLVYLKGGAALVQNDITIQNNDTFPFGPFPPTSLQDTKIGWTAGIGVEQALTPALSMKAEFDYMHFGSTNMFTPDTVGFVPGPVLVPGLSTGVHENFGLVKFGLNYKLGVDMAQGWDGRLLGDGGFLFHSVPGGWSFESGTRYWLSSGKFQWDVGIPPPADVLISRLTYHHLVGNSAELFENMDTPWNVFVKATIGVGGISHGTDNDEDWNFGGPDAYSNTISRDKDGHLAYGNVDLGYNFLTGDGFKIGAFAGISYFEERWDSYGCVQIADPAAGCSPAFSDAFLVGTQNVRWDAIRVGLDGQAKISDRFSLRANLAYLPYSEFTGRDNHLLRTFSFFIEQAGTGEGVQLETALDYKVSSQFSLGLGGRYWAWWTRDGAGDMNAGGPGGPSIFFLGDRYAANRWGGFLQASYRYDARDDGQGFAWADNGPTNDGRWSGWYVGLHTGAGWGLTQIHDPAGPPIFGNDVTTNAFLGGIQGGFNWQSASSPAWVFGIEADANLAVDDGTRTCLASTGTFISANCNSEPSAMGTLTARLGHLFGSSDRTLVYGKGGLSWIQNDLSITTNNLGSPPTSASDFKVGWAAGIGVEQALTPGISMKLEYEFMGFGSSDVQTPIAGDYGCFCILPGGTASYDGHFQMVQLGVNYKLGTDPLTGWDGAEIPFHNAPAGWSLELGTRLFVSLGKFQWDHSSPPPPDSLISRLTYDNMQGYSAELFERLDTPWHLFVKGNVGVGGLPTGQMNDEDWNIGVGYSNTISHEDNGRIAYATADIGYDFLTGDTYKAGLFIGYNYLAERIDSRGCIQIAGAVGLCDPIFPDLFTVGTENAYWHSIRLGLATETRLFDRFKLKTDIAYLPYTMLNGGRDNHLLRVTTLFINQRGTGQGVQLESSLDYMFTDAFSVGIGGRYWAMWTDQGFDSFGGGASLPTPWFEGEKYSTDRYGAYLQASFKFGEMPAAVDVPPPPPPPAGPSHFIVFFGFNKSNLTAEAVEVIKVAVETTKETGSARIDVTGHADTVGSTQYNQKLSERRAGAVKAELIRLGIPSEAITTTGKGETELLIQTGDNVKEPQNRRAAIDLK